ncbi:MAG: pH regulation protein F [Verrucomicrobiota bacterium]
MNDLFLILTILLLVSMAIGLWRVARGPSPADAMLAILLLGTTGAGAAILLGSALEFERAADIALVFALLAAIIGVAFVKRGWPNPDKPTNPS